MFNKILVAIDRSDVGLHVFDAALSLAKSLNAKLMLLHVLSSEEEGTPAISGLSSLDYYPGVGEEAIRSYRRQWDDFESQCLHLLRSLAEKGNAAGVSTEFTQSPGAIGKTICEFASSWGANLIVVGRRGRSGLSELLLGSVSNYVLHRAPCSTLVINREVAPQMHKVTSENAEVAP